MSNLHYTKKEFYKRKLPHFQNKGALFFITYNVKNAVNNGDVEKIKQVFQERVEKILRDNENYTERLDEEYRRYFGKFDNLLHKSKENYFLKNNECAKTVAESLHFWDGKRIELYSYCVMSNHVHAVLKVFEEDEKGNELFLQDIMESVKKYSAKKCNMILGRTGQFWQNETYDRIVRDRGELYRIISYILDNPVKAGLCISRSDWPHSYIKDEYNEFM